MPDDRGSAGTSSGPAAVLDRAPEVVFDRLTAMVAAMSHAPVVLFTVREDRQVFFKSAIGLPSGSQKEMADEDSFCQFVINDGQELIVPDVSSNPLLCGLPPVEVLGAASYAGFPVLDPDGAPLGSLCVIDHVTREWTSAELDMFRHVALAASSEVALRAALHHAREATRRAEDARTEAQTQARRAEQHAAEAGQLAQVLQDALLPAAVPAVPGLDIATCHRAGASGVEVLGDFYDIFPTPTGWGAVVGDVCGKGATAARTTALARSTVRATGHLEDDPASVLATLNDVLHVWFGDQRSFVTAAYTTFHQQPGTSGVTVTVASGGHPAGFVLRAHGEVHELDGGGRVLGIYPDSQIAVQHLHLAPGDSLVLFTDGITEARPPGQPTQFGEHGVAQALREAGPARTAAEIVKALGDAATAHAGGWPPDDIAVLVARAHPGPIPAPRRAAQTKTGQKPEITS